MAPTTADIPSPRGGNGPPGVRLYRFDELDSTSLYARRLLTSGEIRPADGPVLIQAVRQTGGIGRFGRAWASPVGGLWCTLLAPLPPGATALLDGLGLRVGVACLNVVRGVLQRSGKADLVRLKWPNDVLIAGRKVLGVLCESAPRSDSLWVMIGVGLNANFPADSLPPALRRPPTTLLDVLGREVDLDGIRNDLCAGLLGALDPAANAAALAAARQALYGIGEPAQIRLPGGTELSGTLLGLSDSGVPLLRADDGDVAAPPGRELVLDLARRNADLPLHAP